MIFSKEECDTIQMVEFRKAMERSIYSTIEAFPIAFKTAMDCQLELDIRRCDAMQRIGNNKFYNLPEDIETLSPHPV